SPQLGGHNHRPLRNNDGGAAVTETRTPATPKPRSVDSGAPSIPRRTWLALLVLALTAEIAWTAESMFLNLFVFDTITDDPRAIALVVACGAIGANVAALIFGAVSDRAGRRRVAISLGFIAWGFATASLGLTSVDRVQGLAVAGNAIALA